MPRLVAADEGTTCRHTGPPAPTGLLWSGLRDLVRPARPWARRIWALNIACEERAQQEPGRQEFWWGAAHWALAVGGATAR